MRVKRYKGGKLDPFMLQLNPDEVQSLTLDLTGEIGTATVSSATWESCPDGLIIGAPANSAQQITATITAPEHYGNYMLKIVTTTDGGDTFNTRIPVAVSQSVGCN